MRATTQPPTQRAGTRSVALRARSAACFTLTRLAGLFFRWVGPNGNKKTATVVPGQALKAIARGCGIPIRYDCQDGVCKTCEAQVGGGRAKICVAKMPNKDVTIKYNIRG